MKLTSKKALEIIEEYRNKMKDTGWIDHSICVGNSAGKIAESLDLDVDKAKALGYIHDIGKGVGMSLKSHDPTQRANGIMTLAGGIVITFAKEILNIITGG